MSQLQNVSLLKKIHAKIGVCLDNRLQMTLARAQNILAEVLRIIDGELDRKEELIEAPPLQDIIDRSNQLETDYLPAYTQKNIS